MIGPNLDTESKVVNVGLVSGRFDPLHVSHVNMINDVAFAMDEVWVILNNDNWLMNKKGFVFMPQDEREAIMMSLKGVTRVYLTDHKLNDTDTTVCNAIFDIVDNAPDTHWFTFFNGGDRGPKETPEAEICKTLDVEIIYNAGKSKIQSSSELVLKAANKINSNQK